MTSNKSRRCIILIVLMVLCCTFTFFAVNASMVSADGAVPTVTTFEMLDGAGIRTGTAKEAEDAGFNNTNGIRFQAEISSQEYGELAKFGTVTAGTFIMPKKYLEYADLTKENCFTAANQKYTWEGKTALAGTTDGTVKILHVAGKPHEIQGKSVYRIQGSVVDMLKENLDREYIGVSYLKVDNGTVSEYYFAETNVANARSILTVSQNILVENDSEHVATANGFVEEYLEYKGGSVTSTLVEEVYVNSSTGYSLDSTNTKTVTMSSAEDFTKNLVNVPTKDGYLYITAKQEADSVVARAGETQTIKYYYDKKLDDVIIFDSSRVVDDEDIFTANNSRTVDSGSSMSDNNTWGYHGEKCIYFNDYHKTVNGIGFSTPVVLPAPTKTISFMIKNHNTSVGNGTNPNTVIIYAEYDAAKNEAKSEIGRTTFIPSTVPGDLYEVSITLTKDITQIGCIKFYADDNEKTGGDYNPMYIDYIHAEYDLLALGFDNIEITEAGDKNLDFDIDSKIISTKFSDSEIANGLTITVKELPNGTATPLTANAQGKYVLNATEGTNYEIEYAVSIGENSASGKFFVLGYIDGWVESFEDASVFSTLARVGFVDTVSVSGTKSLKGNYDKNGNHTRAIYSTPVELQGTYTTLCVWIYSDNAVFSPENPILIGLNSTTETSTAKYCKITSLNAGWNYVEVPERNGKQFNNTINNIVFSSHTLPTSGLIIDRISLK